MKALKTVKIHMNYCGKDIEREVGYYIRKRPILVDGKWEDGPENEVIFGVVHFGFMTHMCYGILQSGVKDWVEFAVTGKHPRKFSVFYFDAGGNGRPLYATYNEVRRALAEMELLPVDAVKYCANCLHSKLVHDGSNDECQKIADEDKTMIQFCECAGFQSDHQEHKEEKVT